MPVNPPVVEPCEDEPEDEAVNLGRVGKRTKAPASIGKAVSPEYLPAAISEKGMEAITLKSRSALAEAIMESES